MRFIKSKLLMVCPVSLYKVCLASSAQFHTTRTQPKVLASNTFCSSIG